MRREIIPYYTLNKPFYRMERNEFFNEMKSKAIQYAHEAIQNPEENEQAVSCVEADFMEGAYAAWELINEN